LAALLAETAPVAAVGPVPTLVAALTPLLLEEGPAPPSPVPPGGSGCGLKIQLTAIESASPRGGSFRMACQLAQLQRPRHGNWPVSPRERASGVAMRGTGWHGSDAAIGCAMVGRGHDRRHRGHPSEARGSAKDGRGRGTARRADAILDAARRREQR